MPPSSTSKSRIKDRIFEETTAKKVSLDDVKREFAPLSYDTHDLTEKIMTFGKVLTGIPLYEYQEQFAYRVIHAVIAFENETLTALWSRQSGKSETMAFVIDTLCVIMPVLGTMFDELKQFKNGFRIGLYAPQQLQVDTTYDRAMSRLTSENAEAILGDPELDAELVSGRQLILNNGSFLMGQVASKSSKIESKTYDLLIIEECQDMDDFVMQKSIEPMTSATAGTVLKVGTTGTQKNNFYVEIQDNKRSQRKVKDPRMMLHFEFDYKRVIEYKRAQYDKDKNRFHLNYEQDVLKKRRKWGEQSDAFKLGYALIWPLESGMFCTDSAFDSICNKRLGLGSPADVKSSWFVVAGIDFAKDQDSTVITIGRSFYRDDEYTTEPPIKQVLDWVEMQGESYEIQHHVIMETLIRWGVQVVYCDYTGVGRPIVDRLMAACGDQVQIVPYTFTRPSKNDMWVALDADIKERRLILPANKTVQATEEWQNCRYQLTNMQKAYDGGYMICAHGDGPGEHDDYCDSMALFVLAANQDIPQEIDEDENIFYPSAEAYGPSHRQSHW